MSVYFLWRVMKFPEIGNVDATLIGITITCAVFLCAWGIGSGKGNPVESSLVFAYIVLCVYQIFTDYQPSAPLEYLPPPSSSEAGFPPLPPIIMASYANFILALSTLPSMLHAALNFLLAALGTVTPSVIVSLAYRLFVFHASTRIIPAIRGPGGARLASTADFDADDDDGAGHILSLLSRFSPSILITVYTSLLMQHFATTAGDMPARDWWTSRGADMGGNLWRWVNLAGTMALYVFELYVGEAHLDEMTGHWKED